MRKPTPGPWHVSRGNCGAMVGLLSVEAMPVAMLGNAAAINPADVALIAASPDLRSALDGLLALPCISVVEEAAREYPHGREDVAHIIAAFDAARAALAKSEKQA